MKWWPAEGRLEGRPGALHDLTVPFTPFHFGPGLLAHGLAPRRISFGAFCATNLLIDGETLFNLLTGAKRLHAFFHTYLGATLMAVDVMLLFALLRWWIGGDPRRGRFVPAAAACATGALLGGWSHVLLDSVMHSDITPLAPISFANPLFLALPLRQLHGLCVAAALLGLALLGFRQWRDARREVRM